MTEAVCSGEVHTSSKPHSRSLTELASSLFHRVCTWRALALLIFRLDLVWRLHDGARRPGTTRLWGEVTSPLVGVEIARCKAAAGDAALRAGVLTAAEDNTIADRWILDDNVEVIVWILDFDCPRR